MQASSLIAAGAASSLEKSKAIKQQQLDMLRNGKIDWEKRHVKMSEYKRDRPNEIHLGGDGKLVHRGSGGAAESSSLF